MHLHILCVDIKNRGIRFVLPSLFCPSPLTQTCSGLPELRGHSRIHRGAGRSTLENAGENKKKIIRVSKSDAYLSEKADNTAYITTFAETDQNIFIILTLV